MDSQQTRNLLSPTVEAASDAEIDKFCAAYGLTRQLLPLIKLKDPSIASLNVPVGGVVKVKRRSPVTGKEEILYRLVVE